MRRQFDDAFRGTAQRQLAGRHPAGTRRTNPTPPALQHYVSASIKTKPLLTAKGVFDRVSFARFRAPKDDAIELASDSTIRLTDGLVGLPNSASGDQTAGFRFTDLPIPESSTILSAYLDFRVTEATSAGASSLTIAADLTANSPEFQQVNLNLSSRGATSTVTSTFPIADTADEERGATGDISAILTEVIDLDGWASGNDVSFLITGSGTPGVRTFDGHPSYGARLKVELEFNLGDLGESESVPVITVRDRLREIMNDLPHNGNTPITDLLYEAALYFRGEPVLWGKNRGLAHPTVSRFNRVSHPASYTDGSLIRDPSCTDDNLDSLDCVSENIVSANYKTPIVNSCQANFLVFLSDGFGTTNSSASLIREMIDVNPCKSEHTDGTTVSQFEACGQDLVEFLASTDQLSNVSGNNTVTTYSVGFSLDLDASNDGTAYLRSMATLGGGTFETASSSAELAEKFESIIEDVLSQTTSFAAPSLSINAFNRLFHRDEVFFSFFEPEKAVRWAGNVKKYNLRSTCTGVSGDCEVGEVIDVNGDAAIGADSRISSDAKSNWPLEADTNDGAEILLGGAGEVERSPIDDDDPTHLRRVLVYYGTAEPGTFDEDSKPSLSELKDDDGDGAADDIPGDSGVTGTAYQQQLEATRQLLGWEGPDVSTILALSEPSRQAELDELAAELNEHIRWIRGEDVDNDDGEDSTLRRYSFTDPLHSSPVAVTYGVSVGENPLTCEASLADYTEECIVVKVFVGTNDGGLKMINGYGGEEEWVFYPVSLLPQLVELRENPEAEHPYGLDGTPSVWVTDEESDGIIDPDAGDSVRIFFGQRRGGNMYFGLDVTPDDEIDDVEDTTATTPKYMWRIAGGAGDYPHLGQTWGRPKVVSILKGVRPDASSAPEPVKTTVIMVPGGYDVSQDGGFTITSGNSGNAIYAIEPISGDREFYISADPDSTSPHGTDVDGVDVSQMRYPIASDLALMDSDGDGSVDRVYVGDTGGQMWRVDIGASDDLGDEGGDSVAGGYDLVVGRLATVSFLKSTADVSTVAPAISNRRKFFYAPDVVQVRGGQGSSAIAEYDLVTALTGDRSTPLDLNVKDRFYAFADTDVHRMPDVDDDGLSDDMHSGATVGTLQGPIDLDSPDAAAAGDMYDVTNDNDPDLSEFDDLVAGSYYITFADPGEKGLAAPIILAGKIFFTTYLPEEVVDSASCSLAEGAGRLYGLNVLDGSAIFNWESEEGTSPVIGDRTYDLGSGIPSAAVPVFQPEKVTLLIGGGGGATTVDPGITLPRTRTYWFQQR